MRNTSDLYPEDEEPSDDESKQIAQDEVAMKVIDSFVYLDSFKTYSVIYANNENNLTCLVSIV